MDQYLKGDIHDIKFSAEVKSWSGSKLFDTDSVPDRMFWKSWFLKKGQRMTTKAWNSIKQA